MNTRPFDQWFEMNRATMAPVVRWQEIATEAAGKVFRHNLTLAQDYVEFGTQQMQLMGELKDPQKWGLETGKAVSEFGQKMVDRAADYFKVAKETQEAFGQWAETAAKAAMSNAAAKDA